MCWKIKWFVSIDLILGGGSISGRAVKHGIALLPLFLMDIEWDIFFMFGMLTVIEGL